MAQTPQPWDRLPDEPQAAYEAALTYFRLGIRRSIAAAGRHQSGKGPAEKGKGSAAGSFTRWSSRFRWTDRAAAYDRHVADETARAQEQAIRSRAESAAEKWATRLEQYAEVIWNSFALAMTVQAEVVKRQNAKETVKAGEIEHAIDLVGKSRDQAREAFALAMPGGSAPGHATPGVTTDEAAAGLKAILELRRKASTP